MVDHDRRDPRRDTPPKVIRMTLHSPLTEYLRPKVQSAEEQTALTHHGRAIGTGRWRSPPDS